jgi:concentrative nucleoside transporter, CNT family
MLLRLTSLLGLFTMLLLAWGLSSHRTRIPWRTVIGGLGLQLVLAVVLLATSPGQWLFAGSRAVFDQVQTFVRAGTTFVFGVNAGDDATGRTDELLSTFAFGVLPTIIFFGSLMAILYHLGIVQRIVAVMAWVMQRLMGVSGAESLSAAANVLVGHTEAPLVVRPYLAAMTRSELNAVMVGGFATISGGLLAVYHGMGIDAGHLIVASIISAPAALVVAKVMEPELGEPVTRGSVKLDVERTAVNVIDAAATGAADGLKLALNVGAMLLAFLGLIALCDAIVVGLGGLVGREWSLALLLGRLFLPLAWLMGIAPDDCERAGELLGLKMVANEFLAYERLGRWNAEGSGVHLAERTRTILTYALSGFSNFGAIAIQIGGIGGLVPERRPDLAQLGFRAMLGGTLACCMTACIAGMLLA